MPAVRTAHAAAPAHDTAAPVRRRRGATVASLLLAFVALVAGDAAMAAIVAGARHVVDGVLLQGAAAAAVIAIGSYVLVGVPQIRLGRAQRTGPAGDRRTRWALARLAADTPVAFLLASVVAGPLAVGLAAGRARVTHPHRKTAAAAAIFGVTWAAVYLGVLATFL